MQVNNLAISTLTLSTSYFKIMDKEKKSRSIDVTIESFSTRGNGLGRYYHPQGMEWTIEVPFTRPEDNVTAELTKKKRGVHHARLEVINTPAKGRIPPKCKHFGSCGGCRFQHLSYEDQLSVKESLIKKCFAPLLNENVSFNAISPCIAPWQYRNKMEFSFSSNHAGDKFLGLMLDSSKGRVLNLEECHLVNGWMINTLKAVKSWWDTSDIAAYHPYKNSGSLRTLTMREGMRSGDRLVMLTVSGNPDYALTQRNLNDFATAVKNANSDMSEGSSVSTFLRIHQIAKGKPTEFYEMLLDGKDTIQEVLYIEKEEKGDKDTLHFNISPTAFFQPNTMQAEKIYSHVLKLANIPREAVVYDLYCGTGTLGICLANHVKEVIGVELCVESVHDAKANLTLNGITNMRVIAGSVSLILEQMQHEEGIPHPDAIVVDPPRAGLDPQAIQLLLALKAKTLVYVSCNPITQAINIAELVEGGYELECLQPVDQFPQTPHVENIAIMRMK